MAKRRRQAAVNTKDLAGNNGSNGESVECIDEGLPDLDVAPPLAFIVEAVDAGDIGALVVTAEEEEVLGIFQLKTEEEEDGLERLLAAVDVVAEEEIVGLRGEASILKQSQQVIILAVDITADLGGVPWLAGGHDALPCG